MIGENSDIVVEGYSPRYVATARKVLRLEGGHVNDKYDRGGETKYGVSLRFLVSEGQIDLDGDGVADFDLDLDGDIDGADIRGLTKGDALYLFHRCFWQRLDADSFARPVGEMLFDQAVNGGLVAARKLLQRSINACLWQQWAANGHPEKLTDDGVIGEKTRDALDWVVRRPAAGMAAIVIAYRTAAKDRYRAIAAANPTQQRYLGGWLNRANELGRDT
jgi:lysozyme family protein